MQQLKYNVESEGYSIISVCQLWSLRSESYQSCPQARQFCPPDSAIWSQPSIENHFHSSRFLLGRFLKRSVVWSRFPWQPQQCSFQCHPPWWEIFQWIWRKTYLKPNVCFFANVFFQLKFLHLTITWNSSNLRPSGLAWLSPAWQEKPWIGK